MADLDELDRMHATLPSLEAFAESGTNGETVAIAIVPYGEGTPFGEDIAAAAVAILNAWPEVSAELRGDGWVVGVDFASVTNATSMVPAQAKRWGGKRHRKRRRERIFGNRLRRELRHMDAQDAQAVDAHWRRVHEFGMDHVIAVEFMRLEEVPR